MRIAILSPGWLPVPAVDGGAIEVLITDILEGNEKDKKFDIDLYTIESSKLKELKYKNTNIVQIKKTLFNKVKCRVLNLISKVLKKDEIYLTYNQEIIKRIKAKEYDYIVVENNIYLYNDVYKKTKFKNNLVFHIHNDIMFPNKEVCNVVTRSANKIIVVSKFIKDRVNVVQENNKTNILYNCVDLNLFNKKNINQNEIYKRKFNIKDNDIVIVFAGRINSDKGVLQLVQSFKKINNNNNNIKLMIVGSSWFNITDKDEYLQEIMNYSKDIIDKIIFTGYIYPNEMPYIYSIADIGVIPSMWEEPFGVVALEMMAMSLPIIATNSGGLVEVIDESCSICIDKNTNVVNELSINIEKLIKDKELRLKLGANARKRVESISEFNKENYFSNFYNIIMKHTECGVNADIN